MSWKNPYGTKDSDKAGTVVLHISTLGSHSANQIQGLELTVVLCFFITQVF